MIKKSKYFKPSKWIYFLLFLIPITYTMLKTKGLDNDTWYLLTEGRYIIQNGIYHIDPLSIHAGFHVVVQNWLSASLFWIIYSAFGEMGLFIMMLICTFFISLLFYKISMLISDNNSVLSLIVMFIGTILLSTYYIVTRPQIFSFIILLSLIYVLELYIKTENKKYLIWIPIFSLIEINLHASLWWMLFLFILPFVIDAFKIPYLNTQGYKKKPLLIAVAIALLVGFINPYGYKAIAFIFTSFGDKYMHAYISELLPFSMTTTLCKFIALIVLSYFLIYTFFRDGKVKVRYICLFCGTLILGFTSMKACSHFLLVSPIPMAYFFKDLFPRDFSDLPKGFIKGLDYSIMGLSIVCLGFTIYSFIPSYKKIMKKPDISEPMQFMKENVSNKRAIVYSSFNDGGYVEFMGFKAYIDPRAELFLKANNKKDDIFKENYNLQHNKISIEKFLEKYNFTHLVIANTDLLYNNIKDEYGYFILYENYKNGYRIYARNDLFTDEEREQIIESYNKVFNEAKEKAESK